MFGAFFLSLQEGSKVLDIHCKPGQVEPTYIECGNGAAAMQVSHVNLFEMGPTIAAVP